MLLKNLLKQLENELLTSNQKNALIKEYEIVLRKASERLTPQEIIYYIGDSKIPKEAKEIISKGIEDVLDKPGIKSKILAKELKNVFFSRYKLNNIEISNYFPKELNIEMIKRKYSSDSIGIILDKETPLSVKKYIISNGLNREDIIPILKGSLPRRLKEMVIKENDLDIDLIVNIVRDDYISNDIKDYTILNNLTIANYNKNYTKFTSDEQKYIRAMKKQEIFEYVQYMNADKLIDTIISLDIDPYILDDFAIYRTDDIKRQCESIDAKIAYKLLCRDVSKEITKYIFETKKEIVSKYIDKLHPNFKIKLLATRFVDDDYKDYIIKKYEEEIISFAKNCSVPKAKKSMLGASTFLPEKLFNKILELKKDQIIEYYKEIPSESIITELGIGMNKTDFDLLIIEHFITADNIIDFFSRSNIPELLRDKVFEIKSDCIKKAIAKFSIEDLFTLEKLEGSKKNIEKILYTSKEEIYNTLSSLDNNQLIDALKSEEVQPIMKKYLIRKLGIKEENVLNCMEFLTVEKISILVDNYNKIKEFMGKVSIDFESFLQYGAGSNKHKDWLEEIVQIIKNDELNDFQKIKNYFFDKYYENSNNKINEISNFMEILDNYSKYKLLLQNVTNDVTKLTPDDKSNLAFIFNSNIKDNIEIPTNLEELAQYKKKVYEKYINKIKDNSLDTDEIKNLFNNLLFYNANLTLSNIGGTATLKEIKKDAPESETITTLANELIKYTEIIEMINTTNNKKGLLEILKFTLEDMETLNLVQRVFNDFDEKVRKLFELDSIYHLTNLEKAKLIPGVIDEKLSKKYGGEVLNFSDKDYVLYAHVKSSNESIEDLMSGKSNGRSNFISVNPITYKGQKYYYDGSDLIFLYDNINPNTFISSSICNMSSNGFLKNNSLEVENTKRNQRDILETSAVMYSNSETLLFREGLIPSAMALLEGNEPSKLALEIHEKYNIPFVITQKNNSPIRKPNYILPKNSDINYEPNENVLKILDDMKSLLDDTIKISKEDDKYTGKEIAIITDLHSMYEPTLAVLEEIRKNEIQEIYSLGDNIDLGPNPAEVMDLLDEYGVVSIAGNSEYYQTIGTKPFIYFNKTKEDNTLWTKEKLGSTRIKKLKLYPATIDLVLGGKKLALVHFANDVRWDYRNNSVGKFESNRDKKHAPDQFLYTNTEESKKEIDDKIQKLGETNPDAQGYISSKEEPLFGGKKVTDYDAIIQGHLHFDRKDKLNDTDIYTLRAVGMGQVNESRNKACYYVLKEKKSGGFDIERRTVKFNDNYLRANAIASDIPHTDRLEDYIGHAK